MEINRRFLLTLVQCLCFSYVQAQCSCSSQCQVNGVDSGGLQLLIETLVNKSLNERLQASVEEAVKTKLLDVDIVKQQINDSIDEKIINSQHNTPGTYDW